jgi:hypothetical protein
MRVRRALSLQAVAGSLNCYGPAEPEPSGTIVREVKCSRINPINASPEKTSAVITPHHNSGDGLEKYFHHARKNSGVILTSRSVWKQVDDHSGGNSGKNRLQYEFCPNYPIAVFIKKRHAVRLNSIAGNA